jgi:rubrerythrin
MEKITTKKELIQRIGDVRALEIEARDNYIKDIALFDNPDFGKVIDSIKIDENKHIALLDDILKELIYK